MEENQKRNYEMSSIKKKTRAKTWFKRGCRSSGQRLLGKKMTGRSSSRQNKRKKSQKGAVARQRDDEVRKPKDGLFGRIKFFIKLNPWKR